MTLEKDIDISLIKPSDAWKLCDFIVSNEERFREYLPVTVSQNLNPTLSQLFVEKKLKGIRSKEELLYTIKLSESRQLIGIVYLKNIDLNEHEGEFANAIDYRFTGHGIIPFVLNELISESKTTLGITTFKIIVNRENIGSRKVAEKCHFKWVKQLSKVFTPPGRPAMDMELYELSI